MDLNIKNISLIIFSLITATVSMIAEVKPNFIFILADDCTYKDLELYGGQAFTPNMNKLASQGMKFNRVYQSAPMCSPTRHALYTGLHSFKSGAYPNHAMANKDVKSVAHYLADLNYRVILAGKSHVGPTSVYPFDTIDEFADPKKKDVERVNGWRYPKIYKALADTISTKKPVCMFLNSNEPHGPYTKGDPSQYPVSQLKKTPQLLDSDMNAYSKYLAEITYFDGQVGEIMQMLSDLGIENNTLIVVATEQGSSFPFGKWTCYEMGVASGMVARWPSVIAPGTECDTIVEYIDIVPTFIDIAGGEVIEVIDGVSIFPILKGQEYSAKQYAYSQQTTTGVNGSEMPYGIRSVVDNQYRLIKNLFPENEFSIPISRNLYKKAPKEGAEAVAFAKKFIKRPKLELYDISNDPYCLNNLIDNPEKEPVLKRLSANLEKWMQEQGDMGRQTELDALNHVADWKKKKLGIK
jgi:uncharacterized sulfatase